MGRRRPPGEGSAFQDASGQWWAKVPTGNGGRRRARCLNAKDAEATRKRLVAERDAGIGIGASHQSVETWLAHWLTAKRDTVKPSTFAFYQRHIEYMLSHIGSIRLEALAPQHIRQMLASLSRTSLSPQSVAHVRTVLHNALEMARRDRLVRENVAGLVDTPRVETYQAYVLSDDEIDMLLAAADGTRRVVRFGRDAGTVAPGEPERLRALIHLWIALGPRKSEALKLHWADYNKGRRELTILDSKTDAGRRVLPLTDDLCTLLDLHWQQQQEDRRVLGADWHEHGLIFASGVGTPIGQRNMIRLFKRVLKDAGLPDNVRIHDLRHTAATELIATGVDPKAAQAILGHASIETTLKIYAKAREGKGRAAVEAAAENRKRKRTG